MRALSPQTGARTCQVPKAGAPGSSAHPPEGASRNGHRVGELEGALGLGPSTLTPQERPAAAPSGVLLERPLSVDGGDSALLGSGLWGSVWGPEDDTASYFLSPPLSRPFPCPVCP